MRRMLRVLAALTVVLSLAGMWVYFSGENPFTFSDAYHISTILGFAGGIVGIATALLGLWPASQRNQRWWSLGLAAPMVLGWYVSTLSAVVIWAIVSPSSLPTTCQQYFQVFESLSPGVPPRSCVPPMGPTFALMVPTIILVAAPVLTGIVAFFYSFCIGDTVRVERTAN